MTANIEDAPVTALVGGGWAGVSEWHFTDIRHTHYGSSLCPFHSGGPGCARPTVVVFYLPGSAGPDSPGLEADLNSNQFLLSPFPDKNLGH